MSKSLRAHLIIYFLLLIGLPIAIVVWRFSATFYEETEKFVQQETSNLLNQTNKQVHSLVRRSHKITEYKNDIFKKETIQLPSRDISNSKNVHHYSIRELLKSTIYNASGIRNVGVVNLDNLHFMMGYRDREGRLTIKETVRRQGTPWSRYWKEIKKNKEYIDRRTEWKKDDYRVESRTWYKMALQQKGVPDFEMIWTRPYRFKESGEVGITSAKAVNRTGEGYRKPFAIVFSDLSLQGITDNLRKLKLGRGGKLFLVNKKGKLLASSHSKVSPAKEKSSSGELLVHVTEAFPSLFDKNIWETKLLNQLPDTSEKSLGQLISYEYKGEEYFARPLILSDSPLEKFGWQLWIVIPQKQLLAKFEASQRESYYLAIITAVVALLVSLFLWHKITRDLVEMVDAFKEVEEGNFSVQVSLHKPYREIESLSSSFNQMVHSLWEKTHMEKLISKGARENIRQQVVNRKEEHLSTEVSRQTMTLLFSDIRGFTAFSDRREPEEVVTMLNTFLNIQARIIEEYDGDIDKFVGDEVMVLFDHEDGPLRAVKTAWEIMKAIGKANEGRDIDINVGIGINVGPVVAGYMGSRGRADYTVIGDTVNFAARLCSYASADEIWVSEELYEEVASEVEAEATHNATFKGKSEPQTIYRIMEIKDFE